MPVLKPSTWWQTCCSGILERDQLLPRWMPTSIFTIPKAERKKLIILSKPPQALRYSYFHVGQALGTPQQILEQGRPQPGILPPQPAVQSQQMIQQQPLLLQPVPPCQPPPPNQHCTPSRPLQQIQPSSTAIQATVYQRHADLVREQQPKHILKQEPPAGMPQRHLPYIIDKSLQSKVTAFKWTITSSFKHVMVENITHPCVWYLFSRHSANEAGVRKCKPTELSDETQGGLEAMGPRHRAL